MDQDLRRAINHLRDREHSPSGATGAIVYIDLTFDGRTLQLRSDQVTVSNIAMTFRLIPKMIILVSESGTVAIPDFQNGSFPGLDSSRLWTVEGDKSSFRNQPAPLKTLPSSKEKWKPHSFSRGNGASTSSGASGVGVSSIYLR